MKPVDKPFSGARFRAAVRYFLIGRAAQALATLGLTLVAVRVLGLQDYALYMIVWGLTELGVPLTSLGLLPAMQRFLPELAEHGQRDALRRFVMFVSAARLVLILLAVTLLFIYWDGLARWMGAAGTLPGAAAAWVAALVAAVLLLRFCAEMLDALLEQRYSQTARAIFPIGRLAGLVALWYFDAATLENALKTDLLAVGVSLILAEFWLYRRIRSLQPQGKVVLDWREFGRFVWHMSGAQLLNATANIGTLRLIAARVLGLEAAGAFSFMQQLITVANRYMPSVLFANMVRPMLISRLGEGDAPSVRVGLGLLWKLNILTVWPGMPLMILFGSPLLALLSGGRVVDGGWTMALLILALASMGQNQIVGMAMQVYRYSRLARWVSGFALLAPLMAWAGGAYGLLGLAAGYALALLCRSVGGLALLRQQPLDLKMDVRGVGRGLAALALGTGVGAAAAALHAPWWLGAGLLLLSYAAALRALRPMAADEFTLLERALRKRARWVRGWVRRAP